jgi:hypothetical protein
MNKKHYNCILRFMQKDEAFFNNISEFLIDERLIKSEELVGLSSEDEKAKFLLHALEVIQETETVLLVDWEWQILPVEYLKLLIVCDNMQKEFAYGF